MSVVKYILGILCVASYVFSFRILGIITVPSISHQVPFRKIWTELSQRGHEVVVITTDPMKNPQLTNLTEIDLHNSYDVLNTKYNFSNIVTEETNNPFTMMNIFIKMFEDIVKVQFEHLEIQKLIQDKEQHFDLVMVEVSQLSFYAFKHKFRCPVIGLLSMDATPQVYEWMGNPINPVANPDFMLPFAGKLSFVERLLSVLNRLLLSTYAYPRILLSHDEMIRKNFGEYPSVLDLILSTDMLFLNVHPALQGVRPLVPSIVDIGGGLHLQPLKPLPKVCTLQ